MSENAAELAALVGSRICHDLISPLGAIGNGLELLVMGLEAAQGALAGPDPAGDGSPALRHGRELALITASVESANARIRFFRVAYGMASPAQMTSGAEIAAVLADLNRIGRVHVDWQPEGAQLRDELKLAFLLLQCLEAALPFGGNIAVSRIGESWSMLAESERLAAIPEHWDLLSHPEGSRALDPAHVQFALAPIAARDCGRKLTVETGPTAIRIRF